MAQLRIPSQHVAGLKELLALEDSLADELSDILKQAPPALDGDELCDFVAEKLGKSCSVSSELISALVSLTVLRLRLDLDTIQLVELVCEAMDEGQHDELRIPSEEKASFAERVTRLLSIESLIYPAKAPSVI